MIYSSPCVYSFGKRNQGTDTLFINKNNQLGPGHYNVTAENGNKKNSQKYSFGKSKVPKYAEIKSNTPGPGEYHEDVGILGKEGPKFTMGRSNKKSLFDDHISKTTSGELGPGYYATEPNVTNKTVQGFSMGKPHTIKEKKATPGPGEYELKEYFGKSNLNYNGVQQHGKKESIFSQNLKGSFTPGPGSYDTPSTFDRPKTAITLRGKPTYVNNTITPGPGQYNINEASIVTQKRSGAYKVGTAKRKFFNVNEKDPGLGPGQYDYKEKHDKGFVFSKQKKFNTIDNKTPGPGSYKIPCSMFHVPAYTEDKFDSQFKYV